ncbi:MAG TPA: S8 family serine peptidase [Candidatus Limnocylindrales bacterium]|nr:S8 family serine peptidase [Candidatus Limnocylindrales bacterium]
MNRRLLLAVGASALIVAGTLPALTFAAGPNRPTRHIDVSRIDPSIRPLVLQQEAKTVNVILQLGGTPAFQPGLSRASMQTRASSLATAQKTVAAAAAKRGATVTARYQYVYNGLRVRTSSDKLAELAAIPGVVAVRPVRVYERTNGTGVPYVNAPATWTSGATGDGVIIAVVDTGIDYTHANFGGVGTTGAYSSDNRAIVEPGSFPTPKVIGGYDFAGDAYGASADGGPALIPTPDPDPIDCGGHGSHVAGTAAGYGVLADHSTYAGLYTTGTIAGNSWIIGPGVAPEAKLMSLKVFGCEGSTDVVTDALEWVGAYNATHVVGVDVVNMSLGSPFGTNTDPDAVATNNLVAAGVTVVASAGNEGPVDYITGAPAVATKAISVAALDAVPTVPMAIIDNTGADLPALNQNASTALPVSGTLNVLETGPSDVSIGCVAADYAGVTAGQIVAVKRGVCAFVEKAALAATAGAAAIIIINRDDVASDALPTFIGVDPTVAIPMLGTANTVPGSNPAVQMDTALIALDGTAVTLKSAPDAANPTYRQTAGFSSSGPRWGDSWLKSDLAAPGVSIVSTAVGSGYNAITFSGTSMAAPMTAGAAALVIQAHPGWSPLRVKAALSNTADNASVINYSVLRSGSGVIRADRASSVDVIATTSDGTASLSYGYGVAAGAWSSTKTITITNDSPFRATFTLASSSSLVRLSATAISIGARSSGRITATARLSATQVKNLCSNDPWSLTGCDGLNSRTGAVTATPVNAKAGQYALRVPFLLVPRGASALASTRGTTWTKAAGKISGKLKFTNVGGHSGTADVYALGITDGINDAKVGATKTPVKGTDIRAVGVQTLRAEALSGTVDPNDRSLFFAVNMHDRFSTAAPHVIDILVDTTGDGNWDYVIEGIDAGLAFTGAFDGTYVTTIYDRGAAAWLDGAWLADAPMNGSTVLLPVLASEIGLAAGSSAFTYQVYSYDGFTGAEDETAVSRVFDAFAPKQSTGQLKTVAKGTSARVGAWFYRVASVRGWLVVTMDDRNGAPQADIVGLPSKP